MTGRTESGPTASLVTPSGLYAPGDLIEDKYRLLRLAGEGGMGSVWVALNTALQSQVAIKLIRSELRSRGAAERLVREARATARLDHPAVVRVFDVGVTHWNEPFIVMEMLEGESLRDLLERESRVPAEKAVQLLLPIIDALNAAHAAGIIHRDLKPDNLFLARNAAGRLQPKLVDFGIAKLLEPEQYGSPALTQVGMLVGSPEYMAPEQARCLGVDGRSDVWALCVALYELISGVRPFVGDTYEQLLTAVMAASYIPLGDDVDPRLAAIIDRGLRREPDERWASMRELGQALARWLLDQGLAEDACGASVRSSWLDDERPNAHSSSPPSPSSPRLSLPPLEGPIFAGVSQPISLRPPPVPRFPDLAPAEPPPAPPHRELGLVSALALCVAVLAGSPTQAPATPERAPWPEPAAAAVAPLAVPAPDRPVTHAARDLAPKSASSHDAPSEKKSDRKSDEARHARSESSAPSKPSPSRRSAAPHPARREEPARTAQIAAKTWSPLGIRPD